MGKSMKTSGNKIQLLVMFPAYLFKRKLEIEVQVVKKRIVVKGPD